MSIPTLLSVAESDGAVIACAILSGDVENTEEINITLETRDGTGTQVESYMQ